MRFRLAHGVEKESDPGPLERAAGDFETAFTAALADDLNTAAALGCGLHVSCTR